MARTTLSLTGSSFMVNNRPTYPGRVWQGIKIEGLLMNSRMVQGIFDDLAPETRKKWDYPDSPWDPNRNTQEFIAHMAEWRRHGLLSFTINLQGGSPEGYSREQPWINSAITPEGDLRTEYMARLERILDKADELGMAPILGLFYFGQEWRLRDEAAIVRAVERATDWVVEKGYRNILIEIGNEVDIPRYKHDIVKPARCHELVKLVQERSAGKVATPRGRLLVSTSMSGNQLPPDNLIAACDAILLHGNGVKQPARITEMVEVVRRSPAYHGQPIVFNEDDHFDFDKPENNMLAAVRAGAGWGYFDYRMRGEGYDEGYQSVPVNWGISSERKRGFFRLLAEVTGAGR